jgi:SAM-dependent methyltransferase
VAWVKQYVEGGSRLLDVGANFGYFVSQAQTAFDAVGIEPSPSVVAWGREHNGAHLEVGSIEHHAADFERRFAAITLFDVIEHLPNPREALERCRSYLAPGGRLFITTPDAGSPMARLLGRHWYYVDLIQHVSLFSTATLTRLLSECGFTVIGRCTIGRSYRFSYITRRLRDLSSSSFPLRVAAAVAAPLELLPNRRIYLNFKDVVGLVAEPCVASGAPH